MNKFTFHKLNNSYFVSHGEIDHAEIYRDYKGTWVLNYFGGKDLGYTLQRYFKTLKDGKNYLNSKFDELVN